MCVCMYVCVCMRACQRACAYVCLFARSNPRSNSSDHLPRLIRYLCSIDWDPACYAGITTVNISVLRKAPQSFVRAHCGLDVARVAAHSEEEAEL